MVALVEIQDQLDGTDGFAVQSRDGRVGTVEEIWLDRSEKPCALAVRTPDGRRGLLLGEQVITIDREGQWVVVSPDAELRELDAPRLALDGRTRVAASWQTTGKFLSRPYDRRRR